MDLTVETISPQTAAKWLREHNHDNRTLRASVVDRLAQALRDGQWQTTHQGIAFGKSGRLLDGQHRLAACALSGVPMRIVVARNCDERTFSVLDIQATRTAADRSHLLNLPGENRLACEAITAFLKAQSLSKDQPRVDHLETEFLARTESWTWAVHAFTPRQRFLCRAPVVAACAIYHSVRPEGAKEFALRYLSGADLAATSPILALRNVALGHGDLDYWRAVSATRHHLNGKAVTHQHLYGAAEDLIGNLNPSRARERAVVLRKKAG